MSRTAQKPKKAQNKAEKVQTILEEKTTRPFKPMGEVPKATVVSRHETSTVTRDGRGFSARELLTVGLGLKQARAQGVQVDLRRGSLLEANADRLKLWFKPISESPKTAKVTKVVKEKKVEKVVKEKKAEKVKPVRKTRKRAGKKGK